MKNIGWLGYVLLCLCFFAGQTCFGQTPPPNDNYSNSITLTGTDVTFSGTLAGATIEPVDGYRETDAYSEDLYMAGATESVWWNWTAPLSTVLTFQVLSSSPADPLVRYPNFGITVDGLIVYTATNGSVTPAGLVFPAVGAQWMSMSNVPVTLSVPVIAGTNYQIQLIGSSSASYTFRMIATNAPVISKQPRSQAVYSNASCLFYVLAAGLAPTNFTYQWQFNGNSLTNQTAPMLALTNIDGTMAGSYSVVVSNSAGFTVSQPATLTVSQTNVPISLSVIGIVSNNFIFSLTGENGRNYRIQSSTDLVNWVSEVSFPIAPLLSNTTSVVFNSNSPTMLTVPGNLGRKFFRATPYVVNDPVAEICINNLREIRAAKILWQHYENLQNPILMPGFTELVPYFPNQSGPFCPLDASQTFPVSYTLHNISSSPTCNFELDVHVLEDPQQP